MSGPAIIGATRQYPSLCQRSTLTRVTVTVLRCGCQNVGSELHRVGIEVCLDVVFNHTGDGNWGSTCDSLAVVANMSYYILNKGNNTNYRTPYQTPFASNGLLIACDIEW